MTPAKSDQTVQPPPSPSPAEGESPFLRRLLVTVGVVFALILILAFLWFAIRILLLVFAGILLAIFLYSVADWLHRKARIGYGWALTVVVLVLVTFLGLMAWGAAPRIAEQVDALVQAMPESRAQIERYLGQYTWGRWLLDRLDPQEVMPEPGAVVTQARAAFGMVTHFIVSVVVILVVGIYVAAEPEFYIGGLLRLVPIARRPRAREVLIETGHTLQMWLLGRLISMVLVAVLTGVGLWLLGIRLALTLGLLAGLMDFIPNIGPLLAAVPALALAATEGWNLVLWVALLYIGVQSVEAYVITPLIQRKAVELPPALTIATQVLLGVLAGGIGLLLAVPLTAAAMTLVRELYVKDTLGDQEIDQEKEEKKQEKKQAEAKAAD